MTEQPMAPADVAEQAITEQPTTPKPTKSAHVLKLISRSRGATLDDIVAATGWQPHTVRAHFTRLRKAGRTLERVERKSGPDAYHLVATSPAAAAADPGAAEATEA